jgi:nucleoid DNA-binding protein
MKKGNKPATKSAMFQALADQTSLSRKQVTTMFEELTKYIEDQLGKKGPGVVTVPGLLKIKRVEKAATKERQGRNPLTGEPMMIKAKPKRTVVKAYALKALKEMVQ